MDINRLYSALQRRAWVMILMAVLGAGAASAFVALFPSLPDYQADSTLYIMNSTQMQTGKSMSTDSLYYNRTLVQNYGELIKSRRVTDEALQTLQNQGVVLTPEELSKIVVLSLQKESNIIVVSATWTDPMIAALISNAMSGAFVDTLNTLTNSSSIGVLDDALPPTQPLASATRPIKVIIGVVAGLLLGLGIIYLQELLDTTIRTIEDIENELNLKVIGIIPEHQIK